MVQQFQVWPQKNVWRSWRLGKMAKGRILALCSGLPDSHRGQPSKSAVRKVVAVYCEDTNIFGSFCRNKLKYLAFLRKQMDTNPSWAMAWKQPFLSNHAPAPPSPTKEEERGVWVLGEGKREGF